jgi:hypothetical protein
MALELCFAYVGGHSPHEEQLLQPAAGPRLDRAVAVGLTGDGYKSVVSRRRR